MPQKFRVIRAGQIMQIIRYGQFVKRKLKRRITHISRTTGIIM